MKFKVGDIITENEDYEFNREEWRVTHIYASRDYGLASPTRSIVLPVAYVDRVFESTQEYLFEESMS